MDREEYLVRLRRAMMDLPEDVQNKVTASFDRRYVRSLTAGLTPEAILEQFPAPEEITAEVTKQGASVTKKEIDRLWISKNTELMRRMTDYRMGAAVLIPLLLVLLYILHALGVI